MAPNANTNFRPSRLLAVLPFTNPLTLRPRFIRRHQLRLLLRQRRVLLGVFFLIAALFALRSTLALAAAFFASPSVAPLTALDRQEKALLRINAAAAQRSAAAHELSDAAHGTHARRDANVNLHDDFVSERDVHDLSDVPGQPKSDGAVAAAHDVGDRGDRGAGDVPHGNDDRHTDTAQHIADAVQGDEGAQPTDPRSERVAQHAAGTNADAAVGDHEQIVALVKAVKADIGSAVAASVDSDPSAADNVDSKADATAKGGNTANANTEAGEVAASEQDIPPNLDRQPAAADNLASLDRAVPSDTSGGLPPISAVVLFHAEYGTLNHTLDSWERNGLLEVVSEFVFFLNGIETTHEFETHLPRLKQPQWHGLVRAVPSKKNLALGLAITEMVRSAKHDYVLLLEKDWALVEPKNEVHAQFIASVALLNSGDVNMVRYRHRDRPGAPLHARIMHEGREAQMLSSQSNMYCFMHHWVANLTENYSHYFSPCAGTHNVTDPIWCAKSRYCMWTNNPGMFGKEWFLRNLGNPFEKDYTATLARDPGSGMLDFEFYMNWKSSIWNDQDYVVALPLGLFEHQEIGEESLMNTVWYAWNRLNTDVEEKQREYFKMENRECEVKKSHLSGVRFENKYPLQFVRRYHYNRAMQRSVQEAVGELREESTKMQRQLEEGHGNWRHGVTYLTNSWYKVCLFQFPVEPVAMRMAFVTALYAKEGHGDAAQDDIDALVGNLERLKYYDTLLFTEKETGGKIWDGLKSRYKWTEEDFKRVKIVETPAGDLLSRVLTVEVVMRIEKLRQGEDWGKRVTERVGRKPTGTEVGLALAKPLLLRTAERLTSGTEQSDSGGMGKEVEKVTHFVWFDAVSRCIEKSGDAFASEDEQERNDHAFRGHMLLNGMVSGREVRSAEGLKAMLGESGFDAKVLLRELQVSEASAGVKLVDGRTIGGSRLAVTLMAGYYDVVMRDMLRKGNLGTEREGLTIAHQNVEYNFKFVDAWRACGGGGCGQEDAERKGMADAASGEGCRLFQWTSRCALEHAA